jgi:hypothetical protein
MHAVRTIEAKSADDARLKGAVESIERTVLARTDGSA